jgi:two-component system, cell cycle response regulator DivK
MHGATMTSAAVFGFHEAPTQPARKKKLHGGEQALVLIVDDDPDARAMYAACLEHFGYRTASESNGEDGVRAATSIRPAAILMDAAMPGIGGIEATRLIKADPRTQNCPVIVVTASGTTLFEEARDAGCDAYFCKPFNIFALDSVIRLARTPGGTLPVAFDSLMVKECSCGEVYSLDTWLALPLCGRMSVAGPTTTTMELRNCRCGSTLALPLDTK